MVISEQPGLKSRIISGSMVMLSGSTLTVVTNLAYNVALAHFLGPRGFGNANALYTLLTLMSAVTLSFQIVTSKLVAKGVDAPSRDSAYLFLHRSAWVGGLLAAAFLLMFHQRLTTFLDLPDARLAMILSVGAAFYVPLGCRRGYIQGVHGFRRLATNLVLEGVIRLAGSLIMIALGTGVAGVILANSATLAIAYLAISPTLDRSRIESVSVENTFHEISHAIAFFGGQVVINNCDIVLVKHFFSPREAGVYAAIAMVGRVTFSCASAVVNGMFPVVAASKREERKSLSLIGTALCLVLGIGGGMALALWMAPNRIWELLFGSSFAVIGPPSFSYLLALYCVATTVYCLSVVIMTFEMAYKIVNANSMQLIFSGVVIAGIFQWHATLLEVIVVQLVLLTAFLFAVAIPFVIDTLRSDNADMISVQPSLKVIRPICEDEVITGFLKSEFMNPIFDAYRKSMDDVVYAAKHDDQAECRLRRSLLDLRHRALWRELPADTKWFLVEVGESNLKQLRVFPRARWLRMARGRNFAAVDILEQISQDHNHPNDPFFKKILDLRQQLAANISSAGPVILIGSALSEPLTILDGNHRFVAGAMEGRLNNLTFVCGLSTRMEECCWHKTSVFSLVRYSHHVLGEKLRLKATATQIRKYFKST